MMLVGAVFASNLPTFAAETRGQVVNNGDRFGSGGGYIGVGGRSDKSGSSLRYRSTSQSGYGHYNPRCHFPEEWPKLPPGPPSVIKRERLLLNPPSFRAAGTVRNSQIGCSAFSTPGLPARGETTEGQDFVHRLRRARLDRMINDPDSARWFGRTYSGSRASIPASRARAPLLHCSYGVR
jgi:hypothetical protein